MHFKPLRIFFSAGGPVIKRHFGCTLIILVIIASKLFSLTSVKPQSLFSDYASKFLTFASKARLMTGPGRQSLRQKCWRSGDDSLGVVSAVERVCFQCHFGCSVCISARIASKHFGLAPAKPQCLFNNSVSKSSRFATKAHWKQTRWKEKMLSTRPRCPERQRVRRSGQRQQERSAEPRGAEWQQRWPCLGSNEKWKTPRNEAFSLGINS